MVCISADPGIFVGKVPDLVTGILIPVRLDVHTQNRLLSSFECGTFECIQDETTVQPTKRSRFTQHFIEFASDISLLTENWTEEEINSGRRIVKFVKLSDGVYDVSAHPCSDYSYDDIAVSCIYFKELDGYYITSVDIVYLMEALLDKSFSTEDRNRIRRNLERLKPVNCSKAVHNGSFWQIMSYEEPRPRNIEKDIKVFEWKKLQNALVKVLDKFGDVKIATKTQPEYSPCISDLFPTPDSLDQSPIADKAGSIFEADSFKLLSGDLLFKSMPPEFL